MKKEFFSALTILSLVFGDNEIGINNMEVESDNPSTMQVYVDNDDPVVALQLSILIDDHLDYDIYSVDLTDRASDHDVVFTFN